MTRSDMAQAATAAGIFLAGHHWGHYVPTTIRFVGALAAIGVYVGILFTRSTP